MINNYIMDENSDLKERLLPSGDLNFKKDINTKNTSKDTNQNINNKLNINEWNDDIENLLKCWGEKAGGNSVLHYNDRKYWRKKSNIFSLSSILITTITSSLSLASTSSSHYEIVMYLVGFFGLVASVLQSLKEFYNSDEKASEHKIISKQYSIFYRTIKLQLALKKDERILANEFIGWAFKEYEKLLNDAPIINTTTIDEFKRNYKNLSSHKPDICDNDFIIEINR